MIGGEVYVPDLPAYRLIDLAVAFLEYFSGMKERELLSSYIYNVGLRPGGEKLAETMLSQEEPGRTLWQEDRYVVMPAHRSWSASPYSGEPLGDNPQLISSNESRWLTVKQLKSVIQEYVCAHS